MTTNEYLQKTYKNGDEDTFRPRPRVKCADGFSISVQANEYTYCSPRITYPGEYKAVELGYPSEPDELIEEYAEDWDDLTDTVYGYVPIEVVDKLLEKHGGIVF